MGRGRKKSGAGFLMLHHDLMRSERFLSLSGNALKVYLWIAEQYDGKNNGNLTAVYSDIKKQMGLVSDTTLRALAELEGKSFIYRTALGNKETNEPSRYAVTTPSWKIDFHRGCNKGYIKPMETISETYQKRMARKNQPHQKLV